MIMVVKHNLEYFDGGAALWQLVLVLLGIAI